jgi:hypothetical protein
LAAPRSSASMPSVVMNDGRPTRVTSSPLTAPIISPIRITTPADSQGSMPSRSSWNDIRIKRKP